MSFTFQKDDDWLKPYWVNQALLFARSLLLLCGVFGFEALFRRHPFILPMVYRSLKVSTKKLTVLGVPIKTQAQLQKIVACYLWVIRAAVVVTLCFLWDSIIIETHNFDMRYTHDTNALYLKCSVGWRCYALRIPDAPAPTQDVATFNDFLRVSFIWDLTPICDWITGLDSLPDVTGLGTRDAAATCWKPADPDFVDFVAALGVSAAAFALILILFEGLVAVLARHRRHVLNFGLFVDLLIFVTVAFWVGLVVWESMTAITCWVSRLTFLCIPVVLINARAVAKILRKEMNAKDALLTSSEFGATLDKLVGPGTKKRQRLKERLKKAV